MPNDNYVITAGLRRRHWKLVRRLLWEAEQDARGVLAAAKEERVPAYIVQEFREVAINAREARRVILAQLKGQP